MAIVLQASETLFLEPAVLDNVNIFHSLFSPQAGVVVYSFCQLVRKIDFETSCFSFC